MTSIVDSTLDHIREHMDNVLKTEVAHSLLKSARARYAMPDSAPLYVPLFWLFFKKYEIKISKI